MKRILIHSLIAALLFYSCRKDDNIKIPDLTRVPVPVVLIDAASDKFISPIAPASFKGKVSVGMQFDIDAPPKQFDLVVMKNGNKSNVKLLKEGITSFPTIVDFTGAQLESLFGKSIEGGDLFEVGVDITIQDGKKFIAFPEVGVPYGTNIFNQTGASVAVQFLAPCPFNPTPYSGEFVIVTDEWNDYKPGTTIPVKLVSPTQLSFEYNVDAGTAVPILMTINPADNSITVAKQVYGSYGSDEYSAVSIPGPLSAVNPCDTTLSVRLTHTTVGYSSNFTIKLKKK